MRRLLDGLYLGAGVAGALGLVAIFGLVAAQVSGRLLDAALRLAGQPTLGLAVPSVAEIAGFLLAASAFLALPYTLVRGGHIRIGMVVDRLPAGPRRVVEAATGFLAAGLAGFAGVAMGRLAWKSASFGDVSFGVVPVPLALPQAAMTAGLALLAVAFVDVAVQALRGVRLPGASEV